MEITKDKKRTRCEIWTRVMGYHRPLSEFNIGKSREFKDRNFYKESNSYCDEKNKKVSA